MYNSKTLIDETFCRQTGTIAKFVTQNFLYCQVILASVYFGQSVQIENISLSVIRGDNKRPWKVLLV